LVEVIAHDLGHLVPEHFFADIGIVGEGLERRPASLGDLDVSDRRILNDGLNAINELGASAGQENNRKQSRPSNPQKHFHLLKA
jgi:hypothetical protein